VTVETSGGSTLLRFGHDLDGTYAPAVTIPTVPQSTSPGEVVG
jgi:hypothetical protein